MFALLERIGEYVWGPDVERDEEDMQREKERKEFSGRVTSMDGTEGTVDHSVYFDLASVVGGVRPRVILENCILLYTCVYIYIYIYIYIYYNRICMYVLCF